MTDPNAQPGAERREYFRTTGTLYLAVGTDSFRHSRDMAPFTALPEQLDTVQIQIESLAQRIAYDLPDGHEYFRALLQILGKMQAQIIRATRQHPDQAPVLHRQSVIISGSGMQFFTAATSPVNSTLHLWFTFPEYPFATITTSARVVRCTALHNESGKFTVAVEFTGLPEADRDLIIKFVHHRERGGLANAARKR